MDSLKEFIYRYDLHNWFVYIGVCAFFVIVTYMMYRMFRNEKDT